MDSNAIVIDNGSTTIKAGFAGFDMPSVYTQPLYATDVNHTKYHHQKEQYLLQQYYWHRDHPGQIYPGLTEEQGVINDNFKERITKYLYHTELDRYTPDKTIYSAVKHGLIVDFEQMEQIWAMTYAQMGTSPTDNPVLLSEPIYNTKQRRGKTLEIFFESLLAPQFAFGHDVVLDLFSTGRPSGVVVDMGGGSTTIAAVSDGHVVFNSAKYTKVGGDSMDALLLQLLQQSHDLTNVLLPYQLQYVQNAIATPFGKKVDIVSSLNTAQEHSTTGPNISNNAAHNAANNYKRTVTPDLTPVSTQSYYNYQLRKLLQDLKYHVTTIPLTPINPIAAKDIDRKYVLPDGQVVQMGEAGCVLGESLFQPTYNLGEEVVTDLHENYRFKALPIDLYSCIQATDVDLRTMLLGNIVICGGSSLFAGLTQRLQIEMNSLFPAGFKVNMVKTLTNAHRHYATWLGGSILAQLSTFRSSWIHKQDYEEQGESILLRIK